MGPSCSVVPIVVAFTVAFLLFSGVCFLLWKLRQNKGDPKMHQRELLIRGSSKVKDLVQESLQEKEEEQKDLVHVISVLMQQKKELEILRDKHISQLTEVEGEWTEIEKELKSINSKYSWKKEDRQRTLSDVKLELEKKKTEYNKSLQSNVETLKKTEDVITRMTERKKKVENQIDKIKEQLEKTKI